MSVSETIETTEQVADLRRRLDASRDHARAAIRSLVDDPTFLRRMKFERLGCDPLNVENSQNLAEQIDMQATCEAAYDALCVLRSRHPDKIWEFAPGADGSGHDIVSIDGTVAAEVFAAVRVTNNRKLKDDIEKLRRSPCVTFRYAFFRAPGVHEKQPPEGDILVVALAF